MVDAIHRRDAKFCVSTIGRRRIIQRVETLRATSLQPNTNNKSATTEPPRYHRRDAKFCVSTIGRRRIHLNDQTKIGKNATPIMKEEYSI